MAVLFSSVALGAVKDFGEFTLDIPEGWTAEMFEEDTDPGIYTVKALIIAGSDVNAKNIYGMTALMYAAEGNHADTAEALIEGGADVKATNNDGKTALDYATKAGFEALKTLRGAIKRK